MALTTNQEIRLVFELATLRREAEAIKTPHQWSRARQLMQRCREARIREKDLYGKRYHIRVEARRQQLIHEAGAIGRGFQPVWGGSDRFSPEATRRQAQSDVRHAHEQRMQGISRYEHRGLTGIMEECRRLDPHFGRAAEAFERSSDRRLDPIRRQSHRRDH